MSFSNSSFIVNVFLTPSKPIRFRYLPSAPRQPGSHAIEVFRRSKIKEKTPEYDSDFGEISFYMRGR